MCYKLINRCIKPGCGRANSLACEPVLCKKARDNGNRPCKQLTDSIVDKEQRQLCKDHSGKSKLYLPSTRSNTNTSENDSNSGARSTKSDEDTSSLQRGSKDTAAITKSVAKMAMEDKISSASSSRASSKSATSRASESTATLSKDKGGAQDVNEDSTSRASSKSAVSCTNEATSKQLKHKHEAQDTPEGYVNHYKGFAYRTSRPLAPEPAIWNEWREKQPSEVPGDHDSRDGRYGQALQTHQDRAFPLPYEPYEYYILRQIRELGRPREEAPRFYLEFCLWMLADRQFRSNDRKDQEFLRDMLLKEWPLTPTYYNLQKLATLH